MPSKLDDFLSAEERSALERPTGEALGLPGRLYTDPAFLELERRTVFRSAWVAAAVASQLPAPGDVLPVDVAGWPLLLVRDREGALRGFHNVCRHRGAAVACAPASGRSALRCPWHGWTYGLDGSLRGTPEFAGVGVHDPGSLDRSRSSLLPVRTSQWFDLVFVNIDGEAPGLETYLSAFLERFAGVGFSALRRAGSWATTYPCNWKLAVESGIEDYHLPFLHPGLTAGALRGDRSVVESDGEVYFACYEVSGTRWAAGRGPPGLPRLPLIPGLSGEDACALFFLHLFPSAVLGIVPDSMYLGIWLPDGPGRTKLEFHHYFAGEGASEDRYQPTRDYVVANVKEVFAQDVPVVAGVQQRARTRDEIHVRPRFSAFWETAVHGFQKTVVRHVGARRAPSGAAASSTS